MELHAIKSKLALLLFFTASLTACGQISHKKQADNIPQIQGANITFDTSKIAIIQFDKKRNYPFDETFNAAKLTQMELQLVDSLLSACVGWYNNSLDKDKRGWGIDLTTHNYRRQLVVATNKDGQKEVWVNCFCYTWNNNNWKTQILLVDDGGNCYFNFKINLATKKYYDFIVNGVA